MRVSLLLLLLAAAPFASAQQKFDAVVGGYDVAFALAAAGALVLSLR